MNLNGIKEFYRTHQLQDGQLTPIGIPLINYISDLKPDTIFEFGCNAGMNLSLLEDRGFTKMHGIDIANLAHRFSTLGDEETLKTFTDNSVDLSFTCSVLNHLPYDTVKQVVKELKRMSKRYVVIAEVTHPINSSRWFHHPYEAMGFKLIEIAENQGGKTYGLYSMNLEEKHA